MAKAAKKSTAGRKRGPKKKSTAKKSSARKTSAPAKAVRKKAAAKKPAAKKAGKKNKLGVKNSLVNNINAKKKKGTSRPKSKSTVSKKSYDQMEDNWGK